jgi:serine/threonine protein kinase
MNYGRYKIVKELGRGSMGVVYQAHDPQIDRLVVLKVLRQDRLTSEAFTHRFLKEAKAIGRLSHPNIVTVYDFGRDHETIYIAMEFLEGDPLNKVIEEKRLGMREIVNLGIQVAETLDYAHHLGIIHRDIKPSNIIVKPSGQIIITDFGIAHIEDPSSSLQTQDGEILGTPAYMSPEQVKGQSVDGRSDLFSLGIILYELGTGMRPFGGENLAAIFNSIAQKNPLDPAKINPGIPKGLSQIIMKCLEKMPDKRFETGKALAEALKSYLLERKSAERTAPTPPKASKIVVLFLSIIIILAGVGGGIYFFLKPKPEPQTTIEKKIEKKVEPPPAPEKVRLLPLRVESIPNGAEVFVDGALVGQTPTRLDLPAGKHEVRLVLPSYYHWEAQVELKKEGITPLLVRLIPIAERK